MARWRADSVEAAHEKSAITEAAKQFNIAPAWRDKIVVTRLNRKPQSAISNDITAPMELTPDYWRERAERVRKTADFVDDIARETLLRIADNYESLARQAKNDGRVRLAK